MKKILAAAVLAFATVAHAADDLTPGQMAMEAAYSLALLADRSQTMQIHDSGGKLREGNPLLGSDPSVARINRHFATWAVAHYLATRAVPTEYRKYWQGGSLAVELVVIGRNKRLGLNVKF